MKTRLLSLTLILFVGACAGTRTKAPAKSFADRWDITIFGTPLGTVNGELNIAHTDEGLSGTYSTQGQVYELQTVEAAEDQLTAIFYFPDYDVNVDIILNGSATADTLEGETQGQFRTVAERVSNP